MHEIPRGGHQDKVVAQRSLLAALLFLHPAPVKAASLQASMIDASPRILRTWSSRVRLAQARSAKDRRSSGPSFKEWFA